MSACGSTYVMYVYLCEALASRQYHALTLFRYNKIHKKLNTFWTFEIFFLLKWVQTPTYDEMENCLL